MNKGFTLVELIAVIAILGLLAVITTPAYGTVSKNIKARNYENKKNTIKYQTISYVDKYYKDKIYDGKNTKKLCFTVNDLIQKSIISSDSEKEEYIENNETGEKYRGTQNIVYITYDKIKLKLKAVFFEEETGELSYQKFTEDATDDLCQCNLVNYEVNCQ